MKIIVYLVLLFNFLLGDTVVKNSGNLEYTLSKLNSRTTNLLDLVFNNDIYYKDYKIVVSPGVYLTDTPTYNNVSKTDVPEMQSVYLNELYIVKNINDSLYVSVGHFPFRKGSFYEQGFNGNRSGLGIYTTTDVTMQGANISYVNDYGTFTYGDVAFERWFTSYKDYAESEGPVTFKSYTGSGMRYLNYKYTLDKTYIEVQYAKMSQYLNDIKVIDTDLLTTGLLYNDEAESGRSYYTILSYSKNDGDTTSLSPYGVPFVNKEYYLDKFTENGYFYLLGIKQELDNVIFNKDVVVGYEFSYRSPGYHSLLAGRPVSLNSYSDIGYTNNVFVGLRIDKNNIVKLRYYNYDPNGMATKKGMSTVSTNASDVSDKTTGFDGFILQWYLDF